MIQSTPIRQVWANPAVHRLGKLWEACRPEEAEKVVPVCSPIAIKPGTWMTPSASSSMWYAHA